MNVVEAESAIRALNGAVRAEVLFFAKVRIDDESGCWLWVAYLDSHGYGRLSEGRGNIWLAHRWAWTHFVAPLAGPDETLDHLCRNRACVNPRHLEPVSNPENVQRGAAHARALRGPVVPLEGERHGVYSTYTKKGCRCDPCREIARVYRAASRARNPGRTVKVR